MTTTFPRRSTDRPVKLVVAGPSDAGKTTLIQTISDATVLFAEREGTTEADDGVHSGPTTVAIDLGRIELGEDLSLFLFGTPGQDRLGFVWDVLAEGMLGYLLVVDASRPSCLPEARRARRHFESLADVPSVIVVNKVERDEERVLAEVKTALEVPENVPVLAADVRERADVKRVLMALLHTVLERLETDPHRSSDHVRTGDVG
ncbi:MAG: ATP/GTP-binding protein [Nitriliruptoraceae bacterium]